VELKTLGDVLRKRRCEVVMKQDELAVRVQVIKKKVQAWEHDETVPSAAEWKKLAEALGLPATLEEAKPIS